MLGEGQMDQEDAQCAGNHLPAQGFPNKRLLPLYGPEILEEEGEENLRLEIAGY